MIAMIRQADALPEFCGRPSPDERHEQVDRVVTDLVDDAHRIEDENAGRTVHNQSLRVGR